MVIWLYVIDITGAICRSGAYLRLKQTNYFNIKQQAYVLRERTSERAMRCVSLCRSLRQCNRSKCIHSERKMRLSFGFSTKHKLGNLFIRMKLERIWRCSSFATQKEQIYKMPENGKRQRRNQRKWQKENGTKTKTKQNEPSEKGKKNK